MQARLQRTWRRSLTASGLYHQAKNKGTVLEGSWEQLMAVAKKCHDEAMKSNERIITVMRAVDGPDVSSLRQCAGRLRRDAANCWKTTAIGLFHK